MSRKLTNTKIAAALLAATLFGSWLITPLQPPPPTPGEAGQNPENTGHAKAGEPERSNASTKDDSPPILQDHAASTKNPHGDKRDGENNKPPEQWWTHPGWSFLNAFLMLSATIAIAFATVRQWLTATAQAGHMESGLSIAQANADAAKDNAAAAQLMAEQMRLENRPWISIQRPKVFKAEVLNFECTVNNTGKTPGTIVEEAIDLYFLKPTVDRSITTVDDKYDASIEFDKVMESIKFKARTCTRPRLVVPPDSEVTYNRDASSRAPDPIFPSNLPAIIHFIAYLDPWGQRRQTCSCFRYDPGTGECKTHSQFNYMD